ncbi:hypothetical protein KI387_017932, partial [Taxus chinensis]
EIGRGPDATAHSVGGMEGKSANLSAFGTLIVVDNAITEGPHPSRKISRNGGQFRQKIHGTIRTRLAKRELSIVGGDERFKYARGYVVVQVQQFNGANLTFKFTVT